MEIIPSILETKTEDFKKKLERITGEAERIQIDFNDGTFERVRTIKPEDICELIRNYANDIEFEAHMMVQKPLDHLKILKKAGFKRIIIQNEIEESVREILETLMQEDIFVGLAIGPATSVFEIESLVDLVDTITVMDIAPGKQGQKFMAAELEKIRELKQGGFVGEVQADGGISPENIEEIRETGADTAVVGSQYERFEIES